MSRNSIKAFSTSAVLLLIGCGPDVPDHPDTYPVTGTVTQGGKPVAGVDVNFIPAAEGGETRAARGQTDESGRYELHTFFSAAADVEGAVPGDYKVTLYKRKASGPAAGHSGDAPGSRQAYMASMKYSGELPEKFSRQDKTPLTATVTDGENVVDLKAD